MRYWTLRDALYRVLHHWPSMLLFFALGCALGWLVSWIWPAQYKAISQVYVGLNPYRTYSDTQFLALARPKYSNIDNYHYWQMSQLDAAIFLDRFIEETLQELRSADPYWNDVDADQLRAMLDAAWRSSGKWDLIARHPQAERATQASQAWSEVSFRLASEATQAAREVIATDQKLQAVADQLLLAQLRQEQLTGGRAALEQWRTAAATLPPDQPLEQQQRWEILATVSALAQFQPGWLALLGAQPADDAPLADYLDWTGQVLAQIETELAASTALLPRLENQQSSLEAQFDEQSGRSLGFSPNLEFEAPRHEPAEPVRPGSALVLAGGVIGLLGWLLVQLARISKFPKDEQSAHDGEGSARL